MKYLINVICSSTFSAALLSLLNTSFNLYVIFQAQSFILMKYDENCDKKSKCYIYI